MSAPARAETRWPLAVQRPPGLPEIALALLAPELDLDAPGVPPAPPYWAFAWASGIALARTVLDHPVAVRDRSVIDLGCGSGLVGIAAALAGARRVQVCDVDPDARRMAVSNAARNGVAVEPLRALPVHALPPAESPCDVLLAADVLYEPGLDAVLCAAVERGSTVWLADPGRDGRRPPAPFRAVAHHPVRTLPDLDETPPGAGVYRAGGHPARNGVGGPP